MLLLTVFCTQKMRVFNYTASAIGPYVVGTAVTLAETYKDSASNGKHVSDGDVELSC